MPAIGHGRKAEGKTADAGLFILATKTKRIMRPAMVPRRSVAFDLLIK